MGAVYEALDLRLDKTVALKETFSTDEHLRKQFAREARMLAHLNHPSLPRVTDYFNEGDRAFLVMEFIEGVDLAKIIVQQPGPFPLESVVAWADQLLDALIYLHSRDRQVIHRDIKPHNLKLTPQGQIALLDFGLAKAQQRNTGGATSSAAVFGYTKQYAPLEQIQDLATSPQSDIYALGATLYHLLTGIKPPDALTRAAALVQSRPDPLRPANEVHWAIGVEITAILKRAMAQSPEDRYASASDFRDALRRVGRSGSAGHGQSPESSAALAEPRFAEGNPSGSPNARESETEQSVFPESSERKKGHARRALAVAIILLLAASVAFFLRTESQTHQSPGVKAAPSNAASAQLPGTSMRPTKPLRSSTHKDEVDANSTLVAPRTSGTDNPPRGSVTVKTPTAQATNVRPNPVGAEPAPTGRVRHETPRALRAPVIYLPNPDLSRNNQPPVPASLPASGPQPREYGKPAEIPHATPAAEKSEAQVLRARDGTQIVKLPDGSTRVYRPGERNARSSDVPH